MFQTNVSRTAGNGVSVNTTIRSSLSDTSSLRMGLWNNCLSFNISPVVGVDANGARSYDKTRVGRGTLTAENATALHEEITNKILPVLKSAKEGATITPISVSIETGRDPKRNILAVEVEPNGTAYPDIYFSVYGSVDANNIALEINSFRHLFPKQQITVNYDPKTGNGSAFETCNGDFMLFYDLIGDCNAYAPLGDHARKYASAIEKQYGGFGGNNQGGFNNGGGNFSSNQQRTSMPATGNMSWNNPGGGVLDEIPFN